MFAGRSKRTSRDRDCGLVFQWRLPVGNHFSFIAAFCLVALLSAGLAAAVRVRAGATVRQPERRGSLILVPRGDDWRTLEMLAMEAGPMPLRADPSGDPAVFWVFDASVSAGARAGYRYQPVLRPVAIELSGQTIAPGKSPGLLPPLPEPDPPSANPPQATPLRPTVLASGDLRTVIPEVVAPAGMASGNRYLLAYNGNGRVFRVTTLFSAKPVEDGTAVEAWLRQVRIEGGAKGGGWTAVEISGGP